MYRGKHSSEHSRTYWIRRAAAPRDIAESERIRDDVLHYTIACQDGPPRQFDLDLRPTSKLRQDIDTMRRHECGPERLQAVGLALRACLEPTDWPAEEERLRSLTRGREPIVVTFMLSAPELFTVPWDLIAHPRTLQTLAEHDHVLVRYASPHALWATGGRDAERLLFAWAGDVPHLHHRVSLEHAVEGASYTFEPDADVVSQVSPTALERALANTPAAALHILCHGGVHKEQPILAWKRRWAGDHPVDAMTCAACCRTNKTTRAWWSCAPATAAPMARSDIRCPAMPWRSTARASSA